MVSAQHCTGHDLDLSYNGGWRRQLQSSPTSPSSIPMHPSCSASPNLPPFPPLPTFAPWLIGQMVGRVAIPTPLKNLPPLSLF